MDYLILFCKLCILLFIYSCLGWMMEVTLKYIQFHRFINRGYLIGPYCPIYGSGVVLITVLVNRIIGYDSSFADVFLTGVVVCGSLEYFVSWIMEKMYHARWWDYSTKPMNLYGRIWIGNLILFGIGSVIIIKWTNPLIFRMLSLWPDKIIIAFAVFVILLMGTDYFVSGVLMNLVKREIDVREEDNTEEISKKVHELLRQRHVLVRRISDAYPNLQARPERLTRQLKEARREWKAAARKVKDELKQVSGSVKKEIGASSDLLKSGTEYMRRMEEKSRNLERAKAQLEKARIKLREAQEKLKFHDRIE